MEKCEVRSAGTPTSSDSFYLASGLLGIFINKYITIFIFIQKETRNMDQSEDIQRFMSMTNASHAEAQRYLGKYADLNAAIDAFFGGEEVDYPGNTNEDNDNGSRSEIPVPNRANRPPIQSGDSFVSRKSGRDSGFNSSNVSRTSSNSKFMSFSDMVRSNADRQDEEDEDKPRNTFAGGETSGLEVTDPTSGRGNRDPNSLIRDLLEKAKRNGEELEGGDDNGFPSLQRSTENKQHSERQFSGKGYRLGSVVDSPSAVVEDEPKDDEMQTNSTKDEKVTREITFWKEGFQVGDGPLFRYDDPANSFYLNELNQGRAPLKLLNVELGQAVEVNVFKKLDQSYKPPKRKLGGFHGTGQRLGSPIPGDSKSPSVDPQFLKSTTQNEEVNANSSVEKKEDLKQAGDISVQIRYATGKREVLRCNSTDKVQMLYDHVDANTEDKSRGFTLNYAFPVKPIEDKNQTLKEADLVNAVVVQRWA